MCCPTSSLRPRRDEGESQCAQSLCDWARCYTSGVLSCCLRSALVPPLGVGHGRDLAVGTAVHLLRWAPFSWASSSGLAVRSCCFSAVVLTALVLLLAEGSGLVGDWVLLL